MVSFTGLHTGRHLTWPNAAPTGKAGERRNWAASRRTSCSTTRTSSRRCRRVSAAVFMNSGQACDAPTRMLVPQSACTTGDWRRPPAEGDDGRRSAQGRHQGGTAGQQAQFERVQELSRRASTKARQLVAGGDRPAEGLATGHFVSPTVFANVRNDMTIAQEEIFGPVLVDHPVQGRGGGHPHRQRHAVWPVGFRGPRVTSSGPAGSRPGSARAWST